MRRHILQEPSNIKCN